MMSLQPTLSFSSSSQDSVIAASFAPPELPYQGRKWVRIEHLSNSHRNSKVSRIWGLGDEYIDIGDPNSHAWRCHYCNGNSLIMLLNRGTLPALRHLKKKHQMLLNELDNSDVTSEATSDSSFAPPARIYESCYANEYRPLQTSPLTLGCKATTPIYHS
jgi:hypothetical protein